MYNCAATTIYIAISQAFTSAFTSACIVVVVVFVVVLLLVFLMIGGRLGLLLICVSLYVEVLRDGIRQF